MIKNFVLETANNPGTSATVTLIGAATDRLRFTQAYSTGAKVSYVLDDGTQAEWGDGTFTAPSTLSRDTVVGNTSANTSRLNFSGAVRVYNAALADRTVYDRGTGIVHTTAGVITLTATGGDVGISTTGAHDVVFSSGRAVTMNAAAGDVNISAIGAHDVSMGARTVYLTGNTSIILGSYGTVTSSAQGGSNYVTASADVLLQTGAVNAVNFVIGPTITRMFVNQYGVGFNNTVGTQIGSILFGPSSVAYNTTSDYRLKNLIRRSNGNEITGIEVWHAEFKREPGNRRPMLLAHQLSMVGAGYAVQGAKDAVDAKGDPISQQVDHSALVPALIAYTQSLEARIAALERAGAAPKP